MKRRIKSGRDLLARVIIFGVCGAISIFLLMSGYESVYNRSLPFVHTLDGINLSAFANTYNLDPNSYTNEKLQGSFGKPVTVKLPERASRFNVVSPVKEGDDWLARANSLHLLLPQEPRNGNIGITLLYCRSGFRTLNDQNLPNVGSNIFMDTDKEWRYVYKVSSAKVFPDNVPYIASDAGGSSKLIITCNDNKQHVNVVVETTLLSVQGVDQ